MLNKVRNLNISRSVSSFFKNNKIRIASLAVATVALTTSLAGCHNSKKNTVETPDNAVTVSTKDEPTNKKDEKKESKKDEKSIFLADNLKDSIEKISSDNDSKDIVLPDSKTKDKEVKAVDTNGNVLSYDGKNEYVTNEVKYSDDVYEAPNGKVYIKDNETKKTDNDDTTITVKGKYTAPDGNVYDSKEDYDNLQKGEVITNPVETEVVTNQDSNGTTNNSEENFEVIDETNIGEVVEWEDTNSPIYSKDGENWESEEAYNYYMSDEYEFTGYKAEDGSYWDSEESYKIYINNVDAFTQYYNAETTEEIKVEENKTEDIQDETKVGETKIEEKQENNVLEDKEEDNEVDETKEAVKSEDKQEETNTEDKQEETKMEETNVENTQEKTNEEDNQDENTNEESKSEYYEDENGMFWVSYEDYVAVMGQPENVKQR